MGNLKNDIEEDAKYSNILTRDSPMKPHYAALDPPRRGSFKGLVAQHACLQAQCRQFRVSSTGRASDRRLGSQKKILKLHRRYNGALLHVSSFLDRLGLVSQSFYMHHAWLFETLSMSI